MTARIHTHISGKHPQQESPSPNKQDIDVHLWFPFKKGWNDIQRSEHHLMPLLTGFTQEEGLRRETHLNSLF